MNIYKIKQYISYRLTARHWKGFEIQPPFAFDFARRVLQDKSEYYCFEAIEEYREKLLDDKREITVTDLGAGSKIFHSNHRKISDIALNCATSEWEAKLIFRIIQESKPKILVELGTSIGISTLYLSFSNKRSKVYTIEGCEQLANMAKEGFDKFQTKNIEQKIGSFSDMLPEIIKKENSIDFVYIDGDHKKESTLNYFSTILPKLNSNSVVIIDDIYWSKEMTEAWDIIVQNPQVRISFDIFHMGILFFRDGCLKQHYKVWL